MEEKQLRGVDVQAMSSPPTKQLSYRDDKRTMKLRRSVVVVMVIVITGRLVTATKALILERGRR